MRFTVQQKSVEVVDREISWGWPLPARANGKLPGSCVLARGSCSGVLSSSLPTVSFAGALLLTWVLDLLSSPLLCHFFLPFFFSLPQEHHDKIKQDLQNDVTHVKLVAICFCRLCLFFCTCCHLCYFDGLYRAGSASCALRIKIQQCFVPNDFNMKIISAEC